MNSYVIQISVNDYRRFLSGINNFIVFKKTDKICVCDKLILKEFNGSIYTGRVLECFVTDIYCGDYVSEGYCIVSFQCVFPEVEPRFPMSAYMELFRLYVQARAERDILREKELV